MHSLHNRFHLLQLCGQRFLGVLHFIGYLVYRRLYNRWSLRLDLFLLQGFLYPCNNTTHHVGMMHTCVFNSEIILLSQLLLSCTEKLFELHPRLLYFWHAIPLANRQPVLSRVVDYYVSDVD